MSRTTPASRSVLRAQRDVSRCLATLSCRRYATNPYERSAERQLVQLPTQHVPKDDRQGSSAGGSSSRGPRMIPANWAVGLATLAGGVSLYMGARKASPSEHWDEGPVPLPRPSPAGFNGVLTYLAKMGFAREDISEHVDDLYAHANTTWSNHPPEALPGAILYPRSTEEVSLIMQACRIFGIPVVAYAGGTSLEGSFSAMKGGEMPFTQQQSGKFPETLSPPPGVPNSAQEPRPTLTMCIDFSRHMQSIIAIHPEDLDVVVQPGMTYDALNDVLGQLPDPLFFPVDPGPGAAIGGMISTGCSGTNAVRYGTMRENIINLTVVLHDGRVIKTRQRARKSSAGPDIGQMFIGSEGTWGIVTEATLKLVPLLPTSVGVASFPSVHAAAAVASDLVRKGIRIQCVEILDDTMIRAVNKNNAGSGARLWPEKPSLFIKFQGDDAQIKHDIAEAAKIIRSRGGEKATFARNAAEKEEIWQARKVALWSAQHFVEGAHVWTTDVCVPLSKFPDMIEKTKEYIDSVGLVAPIVGHAGDGNIHALLLHRNEEEHQKVLDAVHYMVEVAQSMDGTCTGEHGVGVGKKQYLVAELGETTVGLLRSLKRFWDPRFVLNPGKIYPD